MAQISNGSFVLKNRHLTQGLTAQDFSAYAGIPVSLLYADDFPHWDKVSEAEDLSARELDDRMGAMADDLEDHSDPNSRMIIKTEDLVDFAVSFNPFTSFGDNIVLRATLSETNHFLKMQSMGAAYFVERSFVEKPAGRMNRFVCPVLPEVHSGRLSGEYAREAVTMLWPWRMDNMECLSRLVPIAKDYLVDVLPTAAFRLFIGLHEMRHSVHLRAFGDVHELGREADCDLFARSVLSSAQFATEAEMKAILGIRYITMLDDTLDAPTHWTAPVITAVERGASIPTYGAIERAASELCTHLAIQGGCAIDGKNVEKNRVGKKYKIWRAENLIDKPEKGYRLLARLVADKVFAARNPLAQSVGEGIVAAVDLMAPGLATPATKHKWNGLAL